MVYGDALKFQKITDDDGDRDCLKFGKLSGVFSNVVRDYDAVNVNAVMSGCPEECKPSYFVTS